MSRWTETPGIDQRADRDVERAASQRAHRQRVLEDGDHVGRDDEGIGGLDTVEAVQLGFGLPGGHRGVDAGQVSATVATRVRGRASLSASVTTVTS